MKSPALSENMSEKSKRGRPVVFDKGHLSIMGGFFPEIGSRRHLQNKAYQSIAIGALRSGGDEIGPEYSWLFDPTANVVKSTILSELGRLGDHETIRILARDICVGRVRTSIAVPRLRALRKKQRPADALDLTNKIVNTINAYIELHGSCTNDQILDAIRTAEGVVREREE